MLQAGGSRTRQGARHQEGCAHPRQRSRWAYSVGVPIRVILADDSYLVREGIEEILAASEGVVVEASCADKDSLLAEVDARDPDVVVTDIRMPPTSTDEGIEIAARLRETHPHIGVVILSQYSDPSYALRLLDPGSDGRAYLLKDRVHDRAELIDAIQAAAAGGSVIDPKVVEILVQARTRAERSRSPNSLRVNSKSCLRSRRGRATPRSRKTWC